MYDVVDSELELSVGVVASNFDFRVKDDSFVTLILHYLLQYRLRNTLFLAHFNLSLKQIAEWFDICIYLFICVPI